MHTQKRRSPKVTAVSATDRIALSHTLRYSRFQESGEKWVR